MHFNMLSYQEQFDSLITYLLIQTIEKTSLQNIRSDMKIY